MSGKGGMGWGGVGGCMHDKRSICMCSDGVCDFSTCETFLNFHTMECKRISSSHLSDILEAH